MGFAYYLDQVRAPAYIRSSQEDTEYESHVTRSAESDSIPGTPREFENNGLTDMPPTIGGV
jgi:hypothetical protein